MILPKKKEVEETSGMMREKMMRKMQRKMMSDGEIEVHAFDAEEQNYSKRCSKKMRNSRNQRGET